MHIRRFEAASLLEAVRQVKQELGPDAVVLSSRRTRRDGGWFGLFGRPVVEVTAAVDRDVRRAPEADPAPRVVADPSWRDLQLTKALIDPLEAELRELRRRVEELARPSAAQAELLRELREARRLASALLREAKAPAPESCEAQLFARLREAGIGSGPAALLGREALARAAERPAAPATPDGDAAAAPSSAESFVEEILAEKLDRRLEPLRPDAATQAEIVVGPPGVGKTTTIAKLAARASADDRPPAIVTTDVLRIGPELQLRGLAERLGVPFDAATSARELLRKVSALRGHRIWVDTAGCGPGDVQALLELLRARELLGPRARVHLALSATAKTDDLGLALERYKPLRPDSLILTRIDESRRLGNVADLVLDDDAPPLSWVTNGQRVPEDLWLPDPRTLASLVLGGAA